MPQNIIPSMGFVNCASQRVLVETPESVVSGTHNIIKYNIECSSICMYSIGIRC